MQRPWCVEHSIDMVLIQNNVTMIYSKQSSLIITNLVQFLDTLHRTTMVCDVCGMVHMLHMTTLGVVGMRALLRWSYTKYLRAIFLGKGNPQWFNHYYFSPPVVTFP